MADTSAPGTGRSFIRSLEIDPRLLGMIGAFVFISVVFALYTKGLFISPRNIFNLTIQTVSIAIMATGMVFVIVTRHIDLSVGSLLAVCSAVMAMMQVQWLPALGIPLGSNWIAPITIIAGLAAGTLLGAVAGWLTGYQKIPSFIVTLGAFMVWRQIAWVITGGQTKGPLDANINLLGGAEGTLGVTWSWVAGGVLALAALAGIWASRSSRIRHGFPVKPQGAEIMVSAVVVAVILGFIAVLNAYPLAPGKLKRLYEAEFNAPMPEGYIDYHGLPISVFLLILVAIVMTIIAQKTRLGRYIYATGGNPDAAELSGINTKALTVKVFAIMGFLCGLAAIVAQARAQNHANDIGTTDELSVIAAAVIGGTALSGGAGTIYGAILGAFIMQALRNGMGLCNIDTPYQNIVVGAVLVFAVWLDIQFRKRRGVK